MFAECVLALFCVTSLYLRRYIIVIVFFSMWNLSVWEISKDGCLYDRYHTIDIFNV